MTGFDSFPSEQAMTSTAQAKTSATPGIWGPDLYELAQNISGFGVWIVDLQTGDWTLSPLASRILGILPSAGLGRGALAAKLSPLDRLRLDAAWRAFLGNDRGYEFEYALEEPGETRWILEKAQMERDPSGAPRRAVGVVQDISARRADEAALVRRANFDSLTGLPSRGLLEAHLEKCIAVAGRRKERLALMLIDLDRFKEVNDSFGHRMGDLVLQAAATRMQACLRDSDMIARQGGDEFIAILQDVGDDCAAGLAALRLIEELSRPFELDGKSISIGASVGIALLPEDGVDAISLFSRADLAMYGAKHAGRDTLRFFGPDTATGSQP